MLSDVFFKHNYSSGYDEPKDFFTEALIESSTFDLGLGFFSSSGIRSLSYGFALFIANGGKMRVVMNHILSQEDKEVIERGQKHLVEDFESNILLDIKKLVETLSKEDEQFFRCLSYLISINRIEFVATISTKGGLGHDKYGIFKDENGNKVAFIGSANFSQSALELNGETITVFTSPNDDKRIAEYQTLFDQSWENDTPHLIHIPIEHVKTFIREKFPETSLTNLLEEGLNLRENIEGDNNIPTEYCKPVSRRILDKIESKEQEPRFPFPEERQIQIDAYNAWIGNGKKGIFAMATGSGKTVTALNCIRKQYKENGYYKAIIVVPTQALAIQWEHETKSFNFQNIVSTHSDKDWKNILSRYITRSLLDSTKSIILITTYATFNRNDIQSFLKKVRGAETFIYVADEAHNIGSQNSLKHLPEMINWRIGLSATPERIYDDLGSEKLYEFFNSKPPKYTYRYTMKQAIEEGILCHYDYYPIFIELTSSEMEEYERISDQLRKYIDADTGKYKPDAEKLLLKRKRIIHKAENKKIAISDLLEELKQKQKLDYTFVFVPEGYEPDYSINDSYNINQDDIHIIDEYAQMFKEHGYSYHKYISGLDDAPNILQNFADGDIQILLSMKCLDEGVDIPRAEHAIFCSSTGNPRQFVQRRGRVLRKCKGKEKAKIWDLIVTPPNILDESNSIERNLFFNEVKRIINFAALADNQIDILYGKLLTYCEALRINLFDLLDRENNNYK
ncbi:DEAD/DEAH box helicase family protein [Phocaeicola plebeius]|jgi:superfamily II DNA or RNA helicase|uniref:DEAD/DEAH box helicase family protein n=1 Tax=Phocaeicola plebeius TaxID=310297 RepID=UPI002942C070|nr:DEAD/DEAH box helicase family protein [Phocaeicola plebeius]